jgi:chemotaxis regulatin CheY-phosphate phosphatase CheZ
MTQEELDALLAGGGDLNFDENDKKESDKKEPPKAKNDEKSSGGFNADNYKLGSGNDWPPAPPTNDYKVVHQLDDVTRDSEEKASEIFDKLESVSSVLMDIEEGSGAIMEVLDKNLDTFTKLSEKFPDIQSFKDSINDINGAKEKIDTIIGNAQMGSDEVMMAMDVMQYQDIHRQKIERVINVMRALTKYMNSLFEGKIDDDKRVGSAVHIHGDTDTEDVVEEEDIEALIAAFGGKGK